MTNTYLTNNDNQFQIIHLTLLPILPGAEKRKDILDNILASFWMNSKPVIEYVISDLISAGIPSACIDTNFICRYRLHENSILEIVIHSDSLPSDFINKYSNDIFNEENIKDRIFGV